MRIEMLLLLVLLAAGSRALGAAPDSEAAAESSTASEAGPRAVKCAPVQTGERTEEIEVRGTVAPLPGLDVNVTPQVPGRVQSVEVVEGDLVKTDQVVAHIDDAALADAARQADAALAKARAERKNAEVTLARSRRVFERGIAPRQEVDDAVARAASARASQDDAEAAVRQAHRQADRAVVKSPLGGSVLKVLRRQGEMVDGTPATPVLEIADASRLDLVADVPAADLMRITRGSKAKVLIPSLPGKTLAGTVRLYPPTVDRTTGIGSVRISLELPQGIALPIGLYAIARIGTGQVSKVLLVPRASVRNAVGEEAEVVVCGTDKKAHVKKVRPGAVRDGLVEVKGEIAAGDRVVVEPVIGISDGDALEAAP
ncbi:MAG: efflux RND transporter periplasmic adaptor subunit [Candidatus Wallbacteria bacterium]|nr:efflux RND transporter periplasmic adaptor subunit [Candidatus Wallbacteria bacterium]